MHRDPGSTRRHSIGVWVVTLGLAGLVAWGAVSLVSGDPSVDSAAETEAVGAVSDSPDESTAGVGGVETTVAPPRSVSSLVTTTTSRVGAVTLSTPTPSAVAPVSSPSTITKTTSPLASSTTTVGETTTSPSTTGSPSTTTETPSTTTTTVSSRSCQVHTPPPPHDIGPSPRVVDLATSDPVCLAIAISDRLYADVGQVVVAPLSDLYAASIAAQLAARHAVPLLYYRPGSEGDLTAGLERLEPIEVWMMADVPASLAPAGAEVVRIPSALVDLMAWLDSVGAGVRGSPTSGPSAFDDGAMIRNGAMIRRTLGQWLTPSLWVWSEPSQPGAVGVASRPGRLWLIGSGHPASELAVVASASVLGDAVVRWDPQDTRALRRTQQIIEEQISGVGEVWIVGERAGSGEWLVRTTLGGKELPGGGHILFPDRRLVAFYGAITTGVLGVLGEQDPAGTLRRMGPILADYAADEIMTVPTFEIITTVAAADAGGDGNYSREFRPETVMPWVEFAAQNGVYVVLDLQPGRTDFLSQAKLYEELLKFPHVGLALDPEWRLGPNERHLVQIGSVDAAEVNRVVDWLAALVRRENLPQKLLIVHQFRLDMISSRSTLKTPPELAMLIHMDGQGSLASKYNTWNFLTRGVEERNWWWGWKNFFDEDFPVARPQQVLDLQPPVHFVSFQ